MNEASDPSSSPVGVIVPYLGLPSSGVPIIAHGSTWFLCDGAALPTGSNAPGGYPDLYAIISDKFGTSDDTTRFLLPDLRGLFIRTLDLQENDTTTSAGRDKGLANRQSQSASQTKQYIGSLQSHSAGPHKHQIVGFDQAGRTVGGSKPFLGVDPTCDPYFEISPNVNGPAETRPINFSLCFIICALQGT